MKELRLQRRLEDHLSYILADLGWRLNRELAASLRLEGVPLKYWRVLRALADHPGQSPTELSERVLLKLPTLTKLVDRMAADALVYRLPDASDGRRVHLQLSDRGRELLARVAQRAGAQQADLERALGSEDLGTLLSGLEQLRAAIRSPDRELSSRTTQSH